MTFRNYYDSLHPEKKEYFKLLCPNFPKFLIPFIETPTMMRLKDISYFCGAQYGSKEVYDLKYDISRLDHSIATALIVWNHSYDEKMTLSALFHDASTPAFSHVIDYLNGDMLTQESTELDLNVFLSGDKSLMELLDKYGIKLESISNYKEYSLVDLPRPYMCADRLDCLLSSSLTWSKKANINDVKNIYEDVVVKVNENGDEELSFGSIEMADYAVFLNDVINNLTKSEADFESLTLLSMIVKRLIDKNIISYDDLFILTDVSLMNIIQEEIADDLLLNELYYKFKNVKSNEELSKEQIKDRRVNPLVKNVRYSNY